MKFGKKKKKKTKSFVYKTVQNIRKVSVLSIKCS